MAGSPRITIKKTRRVAPRFVALRGFPKQHKTLSIMVTVLSDTVMDVFQAVQSIFLHSLRALSALVVPTVTPPFHVKTKIASNAFEVHVFFVHFLSTSLTYPGFDPGFPYNSIYRNHLPYKKVIRYL